MLKENARRAGSGKPSRLSSSANVSDMFRSFDPSTARQECAAPKLPPDPATSALDGEHTSAGSLGAFLPRPLGSARVSRAASRGIVGGAGRRRDPAQAGRDLACTPRGAVPRRVSGVPARGARSAARAARNGSHRDPACRTAGGVSGALPAHRGDEPLPVWPPRQHLARLPLHAGCGGAIPARAPDSCRLPLCGSVGRREAFTACCASPARLPTSMALRPSRPLTSPKLVSTGAS